MRRYTGNQNLSLQALRDMANEDCASSHGSTEGEADGGGGGVDTETYDLRPLENNMAREFIPTCQIQSLSQALISFRLLGRVFILEFLNAYQTMDRRLECIQPV